MTAHSNDGKSRYWSVLSKCMRQKISISYLTEADSLSVGTCHPTASTQVAPARINIIFSSTAASERRPQSRNNYKDSNGHKTRSAAPPLSWINARSSLTLRRRGATVASSVQSLNAKASPCERDTFTHLASRGNCWFPFVFIASITMAETLEAPKSLFTDIIELSVCGMIVLNHINHTGWDTMGRMHIPMYIR